jgi:hypothetical protein
LPRVITDALAQEIAPDAPKRFYGLAAVMFYLVRQLRRQTRWHARLFMILNNPEFPARLNSCETMRFPHNWHESRFWHGAVDSA